MTLPAPMLSLLSRMGGAAFVGVLLCAIPFEFTGAPTLGYMASALTVFGLACYAPLLSWGRRAFLLIGLALILLAALLLDRWHEDVLFALSRAAFIAAFFTALTAMRGAAMTDPGILDCGRFLAGQPPGRRYLALTLGGHLFGLVLMYGSISLLGALSADAAGREPNPEIRQHRTRRMLVAILRGFISTLPWSPLAFASAITLSVVPGATWIDALPFCLFSALMFAGTGWALDTIFKPRLSAPPPPRGPAEGQWLRHMRPLYLLMAVILGSVSLLHLVTGVRVFGAVMAAVPVIALVWVTLQAAPGSRSAAIPARRARQFATQELPALKGELSLVAMAGFIGALGAPLALPVMQGAGLDLAAIPAPLFLVGLFWLIPLTGQLGMNPILAVSLIGPLLPAPEALGIPPALLVCTITSAWALSGVTSPFTASVLLIANFGKVSPARAGLRWNGPFALTCGALTSLWLVGLALVL
ncbi:hypothetical protein [Marinibacterium sp. SX1]|uniref:hypothetical protein n=1 Tax=Marinibacterium sp. SX1 TaxID=3388424 RepID=UPI003D174058